MDAGQLSSTYLGGAFKIFVGTETVVDDPYGGCTGHGRNASRLGAEFSRCAVYLYPFLIYETRLRSAMAGLEAGSATDR